MFRQIMTNKQRISFKHFLPGIAWFFIVGILTLMPGKDVPEVDMFQIPQFDKLVHTGMFGMLTLLFCLPYFRSSMNSNAKKRIFLRVALMMAAWGLLIEVIQKYFVPGRSFEWLDWLADNVGVGIALLICYRIIRSKRLTHKNPVNTLHQSKT